MAFTTLGAMLFGETFFTWSKASAYAELLMSIAKHAFLWASYTITPFWRRGFWECQSLKLKLRCFTQELKQLCCKNQALCLNNQKLSADLTGEGVEAAYGGLACSSAMRSDSFVSDEICSHIFLNEEHSANVMGIIFHNYLTTTGLISNVLAMLAEHPEIQDQLLQMDASIWGKDATEFNPYRLLSMAEEEYDSANITGEAEQFLLRKRSFVLNNPNENAAFLPFGSGACACIGHKFVIHAVVSLLASLLEHYRIQLKPGSDTDLKPLAKRTPLFTAQN